MVNMSNLKTIAKEINQLEGMPYDERYYKSCVKVAEDLYGLDYNDAIEVADIIQLSFGNL